MASGPAAGGTAVSPGRCFGARAPLVISEFPAPLFCDAQESGGGLDPRQGVADAAVAAIPRAAATGAAL